MDAEAHVNEVVDRWMERIGTAPESDRGRFIDTALVIVPHVVEALIAAGQLDAARGGELTRAAAIRLDPSGAHHRMVSGSASASGTGRVFRERPSSSDTDPEDPA